VIALFYSAKFSAAVAILRWICLGATLQVITWPIGFIIVARGKPIVFFCAELAWTIVAIGLAWMCLQLFGLNGAGIAFFGSYVFHAFLIYPIVRYLSGFRWSVQNRRTGALFLSMIAGVFCACYMLPPFVAAGLGLMATVISSAYSARVLVTLAPMEPIPRVLKWFIIRVAVAS